MAAAAKNGGTKSIRVLIADDHPLLRQGLCQVLSLSEEIKVVGEAADGGQCLDMCRRLKPEVVLMDVNMPVLNGLEASRILKVEMPDVAIVILTMHDAEDYLVEAVQSGVEGYVLKDASPDVVLEAIRSAAQGESYLQGELAGRLMGGMRRRERSRDQEPRAQDIITEREFDVLQVLAQGASNREIAVSLGISEKTVKNHINGIFRKMGVSDRTQAVLAAIRKGWVQVK